MIRKALPRKSNLAIAQAAAMPKTALSGTAIAATIRVSRIAERASGLPKAAERGARARRAAPRRRPRRAARTAGRARSAEHARGQRPAHPGGLAGHRRPGGRTSRPTGKATSAMATSRREVRHRRGGAEPLRRPAERRRGGARAPTGRRRRSRSPSAPRRRRARCRAAARSRPRSPRAPRRAPPAPSPSTERKAAWASARRVASGGGDAVARAGLGGGAGSPRRRGSARLAALGGDAGEQLADGAVQAGAGVVKHLRTSFGSRPGSG